jgi:hypothetical protein
MSESAGSRDGGRGDLKSRLMKSFLTPVVAAAASAAAGWAARRAPDAIERALPKLRSAVDGAGSALGELPSRARSAAGDAGDLAHDLGERARHAVGSAPGSDGRPVRSRLTPDELEQRRSDRARGRAQRRRTRSR